MGFEQVFDNHFQAYRWFAETVSVSRRLCFEPLFSDICTVKQILTMIARLNYFRSPLEVQESVWPSG